MAASCQSARARILCNIYVSYVKKLSLTDSSDVLRCCAWVGVDESVGVGEGARGCGCVHCADSSTVPAAISNASCAKKR